MLIVEVFFHVDDFLQVSNKYCLNLIFLMKKWTGFLDQTNPEHLDCKYFIRRLLQPTFGATVPSQGLKEGWKLVLD